jgi:hypothetical protein
VAQGGLLFKQKLFTLRQDPIQPFQRVMHIRTIRGRTDLVVLDQEVILISLPFLFCLFPQNQINLIA